MAERRSLGQAILSPDKLAFIHAGPPTEPVAPVPTRPAEDLVLEAEEGVDARPSAAPQRSRSKSRGPRRNSMPDVARPTEFLGFANLLVPLTTRLRPSTAAALKRAGLEQRLRGQEPATVQEIAEEAIAEWLRDAGYLAI